MKRIIKKVAVLGSGVMGSAIACHFANVGIEVLLLDIPPKELNAKETASKLKLLRKASNFVFFNIFQLYAFLTNLSTHRDAE